MCELSVLVEFAVFPEMWQCLSCACTQTFVILAWKWCDGDIMSQQGGDCVKCLEVGICSRYSCGRHQAVLLRIRCNRENLRCFYISLTNETVCPSCVQNLWQRLFEALAVHLQWSGDACLCVFVCVCLLSIHFIFRKPSSHHSLTLCI